MLTQNILCVLLISISLFFPIKTFAFPSLSGVQIESGTGLTQKESLGACRA